MRFWLTSALLLLTLPAHAQLWSGVLASNRAADWTYAGIPGYTSGLPSDTWTQCGATIAAGASAATIQNAWNGTGAGYTGCGSNTYVQLGTGTFNLTTGIMCSGCNYRELRGMGADQTILKFTGTVTCLEGAEPCSVGLQSSDGTYPAAPGTVHNWTSGYSKGSTTVTLDSSSGFNAGDIMILDQCDTGMSGSPCTGAETDNGNLYICAEGYGQQAAGSGCSVNGDDGNFARPYRWQWEMVKIVSCSPSCNNVGTTTVTISVPLQHPNWTSGQTPQAWHFTPSVQVGVRDLQINDSGISSANNSAGIGIANCLQCWVRGVAILHAVDMGIYYNLILQNKFADNYIFDSGQNLAYLDPVGIKGNGSDNLIENNIFQAERPYVQFEGTENGTVVGYNYGINSYDAATGLFYGILPHSAGDDYDLFEGNVMTQLMEDQIHGSHLMLTAYRNLFTGWKSCGQTSLCGGSTSSTENLIGINDLSYNRYTNSAANLLGTPNVTTNYAALNLTHYYIGGGAAYAYNIGSGNNAGTYTVPADTEVGTSLMRWGNYDVSHGAVLECTAAGGNCGGNETGSGDATYPGLASPSTTFPASFYLSARPAWWRSSIPFPAIGPDVTSGNLGQISGTLNRSGHYSGEAGVVGVSYATDSTVSAWGGHANVIPAMSCYLNTMGGTPDGSGGPFTFNANTCYSAGTGGSSFGGGSSWGGGNLITLVEQR